MKSRVGGYYPDRAAKVDLTDDGYFARQRALRHSLIRASYQKGLIVDLCCGEGVYMPETASYADELVGVDFSTGHLAQAQERIVAAGVQNARLCLGDARAIPLRSASASLVYSFSALYYVPRVAAALREARRIMIDGGIAILDLGIVHSLNALVVRAHPNLPQMRSITLAQLHRYVREAGLAIERDLPFQVLPLWGSRPRWLGPLLHPAWVRLMAADIGGRMLDQWLSALPGLRFFAFRHLLVCRAV